MRSWACNVICQKSNHRFVLIFCLSFFICCLIKYIWKCVKANHGTVGFTCSCTSDWMKKWCDFLLFKAIVLHSNCNYTPILTQVEITSRQCTVVSANKYIIMYLLLSLVYYYLHCLQYYFIKVRYKKKSHN